ncbi:hypothetical protein H6501_00140 [Candidatus Woesearchaeota archaeon]|nr:hypothetical protein [Nanoarchaeota archaeon]MCB9369991.1 hypothetical protein [Candidatus Woesearchaeota archaeon]USN44526.1 MAG: hypothetical protein H6500_01610 [Candidatus Woesearchaeota archaeon]
MCVQKNKRAVAGLSLFVFLLAIYFTVALFSLSYASSEKERARNLLGEEELVLEAITFRSLLLKSLSVQNMSVSPSTTFAPGEIYFKLDGEQIAAFSSTEKILLQVNISTFGTQFCSSYDFSPVVGGEFRFTGSCFLCVSGC